MLILATDVTIEVREADNSTFLAYEDGNLIAYSQGSATVRINGLLLAVGISLLWVMLYTTTRNKLRNHEDPLSLLKRIRSRFKP